MVVTDSREDESLAKDGVVLQERGAAMTSVTGGDSHPGKKRSLRKNFSNGGSSPTKTHHHASSGTSFAATHDQQFYMS